MPSETRISTLIEFYEYEKNNELTLEKAVSLCEELQNFGLSGSQVIRESYQLKHICEYLTGKIDKLTFENFPQLKPAVLNLHLERTIPVKFKNFEEQEYSIGNLRVPLSKLSTFIKGFEYEKNNQFTFETARKLYCRTENHGGIILSDDEFIEGTLLFILICKFMCGKIDALTCQRFSE